MLFLFSLKNYYALFTLASVFELFSLAGCDNGRILELSDSIEDDALPVFALFNVLLMSIRYCLQINMFKNDYIQKSIVE